MPEPNPFFAIPRIFDVLGERSVKRGRHLQVLFWISASSSTSNISSSQWCGRGPRFMGEILDSNLLIRVTIQSIRVEPPRVPNHSQNKHE
jgi:hypothetical protein